MLLKVDWCGSISSTRQLVNQFPPRSLLKVPYFIRIKILFLKLVCRFFFLSWFAVGWQFTLFFRRKRLTDEQ